MPRVDVPVARLVGLVVAVLSLAVVSRQRGRAEAGDHQVGEPGREPVVEPDGGWGWSNSGLVTGGGASLLVDTLFDLVTTRQMLDGIRSLTDRAPLRTVVNTHSDGDHCFGNELVASPGVEIIASGAAAR